MQGVEEERRQWHADAQRVDVAAARGAARCLLERPRPSVGTQGDRLAIEDDRAQRQRSHGLDDLRHPLADRIERAREHRDVVVLAVHLDAHAVELPLDGRRIEEPEARPRAMAPSSRASAARGVRPRRWKRPSPEAPCVSAASATAGRSPASIAARRTAAGSTSAAAATASVTMPASAPWRNSPPASIARKRCSSAGGACEQGGELLAPHGGRAGAARQPRCARTRGRHRRSPVRQCQREAGRSRRAAQPTPARRWRSSPDR